MNIDFLWCHNRFARQKFLNLYCQTDQKALNGNNNLPQKEGYGDKAGMDKIYGISVIDSVHFSRGIFTPYCFYGKEVMQNKD